MILRTALPAVLIALAVSTTVPEPQSIADQIKACADLSDTARSSAACEAAINQVQDCDHEREPLNNQEYRDFLAVHPNASRYQRCQAVRLYSLGGSR